MAETTGGTSGMYLSAAGGAVGGALIALNVEAFNIALLSLKDRVELLKCTIGAIPAAEAPAAAPALVKFAEALNELLAVAGSIGELFGTDTAAFESAYNAKIAQDNALAGGLGLTH